ncbi:hypothetical protein ACF0HT_13225 (plasmid) [Staphylococcus xylosus]|uniref:hypothetical protein n=1 Tax=Staphylococcus TaxID=1279 RepID=UPI001868893A|nr:hypothetical protein [Staphylococcus succinus]
MSVESIINVFEDLGVSIYLTYLLIMVVIYFKLVNYINNVFNDAYQFKHFNINEEKYLLYFKGSCISAVLFLVMIFFEATLKENANTIVTPSILISFAIIIASLLLMGFILDWSIMDNSNNDYVLQEAFSRYLAQKYKLSKIESERAYHQHKVQEYVIEKSKNQCLIDLTKPYQYNGKMSDSKYFIGKVKIRPFKLKLKKFMVNLFPILFMSIIQYLSFLYLFIGENAESFGAFNVLFYFFVMVVITHFYVFSKLLIHRNVYKELEYLLSK